MKYFYQKKYYPTASLNDSMIQSLNIILEGYTASDLSSLTITADNTISTLGSLSGWSSDQVITFF